VAQLGKWPAWPEATRARRTRASDSAAASRRQGVAGDLEGSTGEAPGKEERAGVHQNDGSTAMQCKRHRAAAFNGDRVAPVVVDEGGWVLRLEGDPRVSGSGQLRERAARRGVHRRLVDGGDARTESGVEEGLRWWKTDEVDAWAMGTSVRRSGVDGQDEQCVGEKKNRPVARF
jgi:hypothetical protein